jgi:hypothetical protein
VNKETSDGLIVAEQVVLEHVSESLNLYSTEELAHVNRFATIGAILPEDDHQPARIVSKVGVFAQDREAAERNYAPVIAGACGLIGWQAALLSRGVFEVDPDKSPLNGVKNKTPISPNDFEAGANMLRELNFFVNHDSEGLTVEFPWADGSISNIFLDDDMRKAAVSKNPGLSDADLDRMAGKTSLLRVKESVHPFFGNGIFASLEIPISLEEPGLPILINLFNQWEVANPDLPPQFGAWCIGPRAPSFVTFLPNQLCIAGVVQNLAMWNRVRAFRVREFVQSFTGEDI